MIALVLRPYRDDTRPFLAYREQDSLQTLAQAMEEYYRANEGVVFRPAALAPASAALFRSHDICHVIFGLDTTLRDEAMADARTMLCSDVGWKSYSLYLNDPLAKAVFQQLPWWQAALVPLRSIPRLVRAIIDARRMPKKWPWVPPESFQTRTLAELRREYGIRVL